MITDTKYCKKIQDKKGKIASLKKAENPLYTNPLQIKPLSINRAAFTKRSEYDLTESYRIADTECFVSTTLLKKKSMILKEGFKLESKNTDDIKYIQTRLNEIAFVCETTTQELLNDITTSLLHNHNAFIYIARSEQSSTGLRRKLDGNQSPICGYYLLPESRVRLLENEFNEVLGYRFNLNNRTYAEFDKDEVIHIRINKKATSNMGTPPLEPVKDDILSLRQIEESLERLIYKMTVPLMHAIVGTDKQPAGIDSETGRPETDVINEQLNYMEDAGGITTTHRVDIKMLGAESHALKLSAPLDHYKNRVLVGLVISDVDLGTGTTTTGGAAAVVSESLQQNVEMYQDIISAAITEKIITPLLLEKESNLDKQYLTDDEKVKFVFNSSNLDTKVKLESHYINEFNSKLITRDEYRIASGRNPLTTGEKKDIFADQGIDPNNPSQMIGEQNGNTPTQSSNPTTNYTNPTNQYSIEDSIKTEEIDTTIQKELNIGKYVDCLLAGKAEMAAALLCSKLSNSLDQGTKIEDSIATTESQAIAKSLTTVITTRIMPSIKDRRILMDTVERFIVRRLTDN